MAAALLTTQRGMRGELPGQFIDHALQTAAEDLDQAVLQVPRESRRAIHIGHVAILDIQSAFKSQDQRRIGLDVRILRAARDSVESALRTRAP